MRKWISLLVATLALAGCGDALNDKLGADTSDSASVAAPEGTPKLVIVRVKGQVSGMDAVKNGEARVIDASKEDLTAGADAAEKLFATGETVHIAESLERDDADESSTQSWWFGWGRGYRSFGFGWPSYGFYRPYSFYNPFYYGYAGAAACAAPAYYGCASAYYTPYYYGGYSYYPYAWW